jgi:hypothetical protein
MERHPSVSKIYYSLYSHKLSYKDINMDTCEVVEDPGFRLLNRVLVLSKKIIEIQVESCNFTDKRKTGFDSRKS